MGKHIREFYISIDVEADGPCPGVNSMLQFGAVFYDADGNVLYEYLANIYPIEGAVQNPETMDWWTKQEEKNPGLWESMMQDRVTAKVAMERFQTAVKRFAGALRASPLVVAYPAGFDFTYTYWYLCKFLGQSCVGFSALDMKTMAMCLINRSYHDSSKRRFPRSWFNPDFKHTHNALDDARGQGYNFFKMKEALGDLYATKEPYFGAAAYPLAPTYDDDDTQ
jgi:oligoribonuclease (3'-5' exoribonuclease)